MEISVIIVNWNTKDLLMECLKSVFQTIRGIPFEVWLVDNSSSDGSVQAATAAYPSINVIRNHRNLGFAAANNVAFQKMKGRYALLLNTDALLTDGAVKALYDFMETRPQSALACGQLLNDDGSKQNSIANFPSLLTLLSNETVLRMLLPGRFPSKRRDYKGPIEIESCIGACMIARKRAMDEVGFLDERFFFFLEETDWALRMKLAGWQVWFVPQARIYHRQGRSVGHGVHSRKIFYRSRYLYFKKWHSRRYPLFFAVIFARLVAETLFSFIGALATIGLIRTVRYRTVLYLRLMAWHLRGCPGTEKNAG